MTETMRHPLPAILLSISIVLAGYFISQSLVKAKKLDRVVTVKGLAEREVEADVATWPLELTVSGNELSNLQQQLEANTSGVISFFKARGFNEEEMTVGAPTIQDSRAQLYGGQNRYDQDRYIAKVEFNLRTGEIEKLNVTMSEIPELIGKGILISSKNTWQPIQYLYTKLNDIKPAMIEEATKNAREVAEKFARDSGSKVGKIKSANQGLFSITDRDSNSGVIKKVRVVSTLVFYLED
jgi:hypothetical protein